MNHYFETLLLPDSAKQMVEELAPCFYGQRDRTQVFISSLNRIVWEYNFVNQTFISQYRLLSSKKFVDENTGLPLFDVLVFGGAYPFSRG